MLTQHVLSFLGTYSSHNILKIITAISQWSPPMMSFHLTNTWLPPQILHRKVDQTATISAIVSLILLNAIVLCQVFAIACYETHFVCE